MNTTLNPNPPYGEKSAFHKITVTLPQVSLAVGASKLQAAMHSTVLAATQLIVGMVVSTTVTVWLQVA